MKKMLCAVALFAVLCSPVAANNPETCVVDGVIVPWAMCPKPAASEGVIVPWLQDAEGYDLTTEGVLYSLSLLTSLY